MTAFKGQVLNLAGSKVDEMMAETPEHLSQLGDEDEQGPEAANTQSSPTKAAESDAEHATSPGQKIHRQGPENEGPPGTCQASLYASAC